MRSRRTLKLVGAILGGILLPGGIYLGYLQLSGNFHPVIENVVYRSAQPSGSDVERWARERGIKSIINLRGSNPGAPWYDTERAAAEKMDVTHYNFRMSAREELSQARAEELIALMAKVEKPVLIHCQAGADRTGLASALYLAAIAKQGEDTSEAQISFRYGHISIPGTQAYPMDSTFEALEPWLGFKGS